MSLTDASFTDTTIFSFNNSFARDPRVWIACHFILT
jgi:hypothetical protein